MDVNPHEDLRYVDLFRFGTHLDMILSAEHSMPVSVSQNWKMTTPRFTKSFIYGSCL